jgi:hypothetical protein
MGTIRPPSRLIRSQMHRWGQTFVCAARHLRPLGVALSASHSEAGEGSPRSLDGLSVTCRRWLFLTWVSVSKASGVTKMPVNGDPHKMLSSMIKQCWNALEEMAVIMLCAAVGTPELPRPAHQVRLKVTAATR